MDAYDYAAMSSHLDDLPERTDEHVGETDSARAFAQIVKDPLFIIQGKRENDYGVDVTIEALFPPSNPTNVTAHAQLKASTKEANTDASFSYSVARTNLNYLLNHPRSIYVFFSREIGELYYREAEDVFVEYEKGDPAWRTQASVTVRFKEKFDAGAAEKLHKRMLEEARAERELRLLLRQSGSYLAGGVVYAPGPPRVTNVAELLAELEKTGLARASAGRASEVLEILSKIPPESLTTARLRLVAGFALFQVGHNGAALEHLAECKIGDLPSDDDRSLARLVIASLRRSLRLLNHGEYEAELAAVQRDYPNTVPAIYARLERLRHEGLRAASTDLVDESDALASRMEAKGVPFVPIALQARTVNLEIRFRLLDRITNGMIAATHTSRLLGIDEALVADRAVVAMHISALIKQWFLDFETVFKLADTLKSKLVLAEAIYAHSACLLEHEAVSRKLVEQTAEITGGSSKLLERVVARLDLAEKHFGAEGAQELQLQTSLLRADALWLLGARADAQKAAESVAKDALALALPAIRQRALRVAAGESPFKEIDALPSIFDV